MSLPHGRGLAGPAGIPTSIVEDRLNIEVADILTETATIERFRALGNDPRPSSSDEFKARIIADINKWAARRRWRTYRTDLVLFSKPTGAATTSKSGSKADLKGPTSGVRPEWWTVLGSGFDSSLGVAILVLRGAEIAERGVEYAGIVDLIDEAWKVSRNVLESFVGHQIHGFNLESLHESFRLWRYRMDCRGGSSNLTIRTLVRQRDRFLKRIGTHGRNDARSPAGDFWRLSTGRGEPFNAHWR